MIILYIILEKKLIDSIVNYQVHKIKKYLKDFNYSMIMMINKVNFVMVANYIKGLHSKLIFSF